MSVSRRKTLAVLGGGFILAAGGGAAGYVTSRDPDAARQPWRDAGRLYDDPIRNALSYAVTAPNPHNRQPWLVKLDGPRSATLYCDDGRLLPETDPFSRQIMIGLGCFLETLALAAGKDGLVAEMDLFPDGFPQDTIAADRPVARVTLADGGNADPMAAPLADAILARRSNKEPYDLARPVSQAVLAALSPHVDGGTVDAEMTERLRDLAWRGHQVESFTPRTLQESIDLMRFRKGQIEATPDGIDLGGPLFETLNRVGLLTPETIADTESTAFAQGLAAYNELIHSAMGWVWIVTPGNSRTDQIAAGRRYVRANLRATLDGLSMHPLSQTLQEYPEMDALRAEMDGALGIVAPARLQMLARIGYGPNVAPSPRWPLDSRIA